MRILALILIAACVGEREPEPTPPDAGHVCAVLACDWLWCEAAQACVCREVVGDDFTCPE